MPRRSMGCADIIIRNSFRENMPRQDYSCLLVLTLAVSPCSAAGAQPVEAHGNLALTVVDSAGLAVAGARISVAGRAGFGESDARGRYTLRNVAPGRIALDLQRLGFERKAVVVHILGGRTTAAVITMARAVQSLEPATVSVPGAPARPTRFGEFERRRRSAFGHFITREEIEQRNSVNFTDLLRVVPGVRILAGFGQSGVRLRGARCPPHVWIDGTPAGAGEFNLDALPLQTVEGVEVYSGVSNVPAELMAGRARGRCGVIVVWTRVN